MMMAHDVMICFICFVCFVWMYGCYHCCYYLLTGGVALGIAAKTNTYTHARPHWECWDPPFRCNKFVQMTCSKKAVNTIVFIVALVSVKACSGGQASPVKLRKMNEKGEVDFRRRKVRINLFWMLEWVYTMIWREQSIWKDISNSDLLHSSISCMMILLQRQSYHFRKKNDTRLKISIPAWAAISISAAMLICIPVCHAMCPITTQLSCCLLKPPGWLHTNCHVIVKPVVFVPNLLGCCAVTYGRATNDGGIMTTTTTIIAPVAYYADDVILLSYYTLCAWWEVTLVSSFDPWLVYDREIMGRSNKFPSCRGTTGKFIKKWRYLYAGELI